MADVRYSTFGTHKGGPLGCASIVCGTPHMSTFWGCGKKALGRHLIAIVWECTSKKTRHTEDKCERSFSSKLSTASLDADTRLASLGLDWSTTMDARRRT